MMPARVYEERLIDRLPRVRGRLTENAPRGPMTWFRVGGPAEVLFRPADPDDLACFLAGKPEEVKVTVIAAGFDSGQLPYKKVDIRRELAASSRSTPAPSTSPSPQPKAADPEPREPVAVPNGAMREPVRVDDEMDVPDFLK